MYRYVTLVLVAVLSMSALSQDKYRIIKNSYFKRGEHVEYNIHYGFLSVGKAIVDVEEKNYILNGRVCYKIDVVGKTTGAVGIVAKVNDNWRTYLDTTSFIPHRFYRKIEEGNYRRNEITDFNPLANTATVNFEEFGANDPPEKQRKKGTKYIAVPDYVQDMVSGYYYIRTIDFSKMKPDESFQLSGVLEDALYHMKFTYKGKELIRTKFGKIYAHKVVPKMFKNEMFDGENSIRFWVSDDKNRVPVRIEADMYIGKVVCELSDYKNLRHKIVFNK